MCIAGPRILVAELCELRLDENEDSAGQSALHRNGELENGGWKLIEPATQNDVERFLKP